MKILFVASEKDEAGLNMAYTLIDTLEMRRVYENLYCKDEWILKLVKNDVIYLDNIDKNSKYDLIIFLSKHTSTSGLSSLSVHPTGNPGPYADMGGSPYKLAPTNPKYMSSALYYMHNYSRFKYPSYRVSLEVTHHGPTELSTPSFFIEIGSKRDDWLNKDLANINIQSILDALSDPLEGVVAIGVGGPHYAPKFSRLLLEEKYLIGHILSKHIVRYYLNEWIIKEALKKSCDASIVLIDKKGIDSESRRKLINLLTELDVDYIII